MERVRVVTEPRDGQSLGGDPVDELVMDRLGTYQGKKLVSVMRADAAEQKSGEAGEAKGAIPADLQPLASRVRAILQAQVSEVRAPERLTDSPVCLVVPSDGLHASVEGIEESAAVGSPVRFRITVENQGTTAISSVKTTVRLSDNARSAQGMPGGRVTGNTIEFLTQDFPSGSREYVVQAEVANRGDVVVRATIQVESPLLTAGPIVGDAVVPIPQQ